MDNKRLLKSYVWHEDKCFFISTIERDSDISANPRARHVETIAWEYDWDKQEREGLLYMTGHNWNAFSIHSEMCRQLFFYGKYKDNE